MENLSPTIIVITAACVILFILGSLFNKSAKKKFEYSFFSNTCVFVSALYSALVLGGISLFSQKLVFFGAFALPWAMIVMGIALIGCQVRVNCVQTNLKYGLVGSTIQIPTLFVSSLILLSVVLFFKLLMLFEDKRSSVEKKKDMDWYYDRRNPNGHHKKMKQ